MADLYLMDCTTAPDARCTCCDENPALPGQGYCAACRLQAEGDERVREVFERHGNTITLILGILAVLCLALLVGFNVGLDEGERRGAAAAMSHERDGAAAVGIGGP